MRMNLPKETLDNVFVDVANQTPHMVTRHDSSDVDLLSIMPIKEKIKMKDTFDYAIGTEKIHPIDGFYSYSAKLRWLVRNPGPQFKAVSYSEHHIRNEFWGETRAGSL